MVYSNALKYNGRRFRFLPKKKEKSTLLKKNVNDCYGVVARGQLTKDSAPALQT